jgi:predicted O-methyltransferase YrrM
MEHFYKNIDGFFEFQGLYSQMVERFPSGSRFAEVGVYQGTSFAYLMVEVINSGKDIEVWGIDGWPFDWNNILQRFLDNMKPVEGKFKYIQGNSWESAERFQDKSLDFVFIDADHDYDSVRKDIAAYLPKVKPGGVISGHDYNNVWEGLRRAVDERFGDRVIANPKESTWMVNI